MRGDGNLCPSNRDNTRGWWSEEVLEAAEAGEDRPHEEREDVQQRRGLLGGGQVAGEEKERPAWGLEFSNYDMDMYCAVTIFHSRYK